MTVAQRPSFYSLELFSEPSDGRKAHLYLLHSPAEICQALATELGTAAGLVDLLWDAQAVRLGVHPHGHPAHDVSLLPLLSVEIPGHERFWFDAAGHLHGPLHLLQAGPPAGHEADDDDDEEPLPEFLARLLEEEAPGEFRVYVDWSRLPALPALPAPTLRPGQPTLVAGHYHAEQDTSDAAWAAFGALLAAADPDALADFAPAYYGWNDRELGLAEADLPDAATSPLATRQPPHPHRVVFR